MHEVIIWEGKWSQLPRINYLAYNVTWLCFKHGKVRCFFLYECSQVGSTHAHSPWPSLEGHHCKQRQHGVTNIVKIEVVSFPLPLLFLSTRVTHCNGNQSNCFIAKAWPQETCVTKVQVNVTSVCALPLCCVTSETWRANWSILEWLEWLCMTGNY